MKTTLGWAAIAACWLVASPVRADDRALARDHYVRGTKAFDLGAFDEAIREYTDAYRIRDNPALLYNIAQAHRLAGHKSEALHFYKIYLSKLPEAANRDEVRSKIEELQKALDQEAKAQTMPPNAPLSPEARPTATAPPSSPVVAIPAPTPLPEEAKPAPATRTPRSIDLRAGRTPRIAGLTTAAVGVALAIVGVAFAALARQSSDDLTALAHVRQPYDPSKYSAGQTDQTLAGVFLGLGTAALVGGVVAYVVGVRQARAVRSTAAQALRLAGLALEGTF
jgi:tetratricopeptide (TPR) repeat protein